MPLPTAYGTNPIGGALPEAYIDPLLPFGFGYSSSGELPSSYGVLLPAVRMLSTAVSGVAVANSTEYDLGQTSFTLPIEIAMPDYTPSADQWLYYKYQDASNYWGLRVKTTGVLNFIAVTGGVTRLDIDSTASVSVTNGLKLLGAISVTRESASVAGSALFTINGSTLGTAVAITAATPSSISNTGSLYIAGTNAAGTESTLLSAYPYNRALSAAEVLSLCNNGVAAGDVGASQAAIYTSDFSVGSDSWVAGSGNTFTGNVDAINGSDNWARIERTSTSGGMSATRTSTSAVGYKRQTIRIFNPSGSAITHVRVSVAADVVSVLPAVISTPANTEVFVTVYYQTISANATLRVVACDSSGASTVIGTGNPIYFKDIVYGTAGNTLALAQTGLDASGLTWTDSSGNGNNGTLPASGATKVTIRK